MAAYVISEVESLDESYFERYRALAAASIEKYGGRYLVRGATPDVVEDEILPERRIVIVEFPDMATARRWYASSAYAEALAVRDLALKRRLLFVEGV
jgi:uncharacterized protein (DUF1330 family)